MSKYFYNLTPCSGSIIIYVQMSNNKPFDQYSGLSEINKKPGEYNYDRYVYWCSVTTNLYHDIIRIMIIIVQYFKLTKI